VTARICILTPGALGSNPRVVKEAEALTEAGYRVTTVSTRTLDNVDRLDDSLLANARWRAERLDFRTRGTTWRVRRAAQIMWNAAFATTRLAGIAERAASPLTRPLAAAGSKLAADLYIAHYPAALPAAAYAARLHNARYAYDAEDYHCGEWPQTSEFDASRRLLHAVEDRYLAKCAYITAASPGIADAYAETYRVQRPTVVLNVFPRAQAPAAATLAGAAVPAPSIYWFSQTIGPNRGLETAVEAIGRARTLPHLYLRGNAAAGFAERLHTIASRLGAADRLHFLSPEPPAEMARLASLYDLGLSSETGYTVNRSIALNNKLFTYLLGGIPVLLSDIPAHRAFAPQAIDAVRLYAAADAKALAAAIDGVVGEPRRLAAARAAAWQYGQARFNWDVEQLTLLGCVGSVFTSRHEGRLN